MSSAALIVDRSGDIVAANTAHSLLLEGCASWLLVPADVTVSELRLEAFLPADAATAAALADHAKLAT